MKVQLIVVQGKPEGKMIPLAGPRFKIGRGESCHLRPNSEQVSREHAEFAVAPDKVTVRDLGSRNGTLVNGKALTEPCTLKDRDLIQIGPLTFAISIQGAPAPAAAKGPAPAKAKAASPDDVSHADIESWLIADSTSPTPERPSAVYGGDTLTITAHKGDKKGSETAAEPGLDKESETKDDVETVSDDETAEETETPEEEEFVDETNPFYAAKKKPEPTVKAPAKDSSDAAGDILRRLMERRRPK
jgi:predicted component of type VI protein secretion system